MSKYLRPSRIKIFVPVERVSESFDFEGPDHPHLLFSPATVEQKEAFVEASSKGDAAQMSRVLGELWQEQGGDWLIAHVAGKPKDAPSAGEERGRWLVEKLLYARDVPDFQDALMSIFVLGKLEGNASAK